MWTIVEYEPTALFSLRPYTATSSGGKTLLTPTPFAIKMALLDVAIRTQGFDWEQVETLFPAIRDLQIAVRLCDRIVVNKTFAKILRLKEFKVKAAEKAAAVAQAKEKLQWPFQGTIAYREYVHFSGSIWLAFNGLAIEQLAPLLLQINYFGKRGGFMQLRTWPETVESLPDHYTILTASFGQSFPLGTLQLLDDFGEKATLQHANVFDPKGIRANEERVFHHIVLPYRPVKSSRSFTLYERIDRG